MPISVRLNVTNTLIAYMTSRLDTEPWVYQSVAIAADPISQMPLLVTRRSDSCANRRGAQESTAMFARMRGPSRKPVCAATKRMAPAAMRVMITRSLPRANPPITQVPKTFSARMAFITLAWCGRAPVSR